MRIRSIRITGIALAALAMPVSLPAFAQDAAQGPAGKGTSDASPSHASTQPPGASSAEVSNQPMGDAAPQATITRVNGAWRLSQLVRTAVYSEKGLVLGSVNDLLISSDGKVQDAVVSVGGLLGIGSKLVKVPFDKLELVPSKANPAHAGAGSTVATPKNAPEAAKGETKPLGTPGASSATQHQNDDYGLIYPGATKERLRSAPAFNFKPS